MTKVAGTRTCVAVREAGGVVVADVFVTVALLVVVLGGGVTLSEVDALEIVCVEVLVGSALLTVVLLELEWLEPPHPAIRAQASNTKKLCAECLTLFMRQPITTPGEEVAVCEVRQSPRGS